jgi:hypothetical protein
VYSVFTLLLCFRTWRIPSVGTFFDFFKTPLGQPTDNNLNSSKQKRKRKPKKGKKKGEKHLPTTPGKVKRPWLIGHSSGCQENRLCLLTALFHFSRAKS